AGRAWTEQKWRACWSPLGLSRAQHGVQNAGMGATPAQVTVESLLDLLGRWTRCLREQRFRCHDHAVRAVAALRRLLGHERRLHRVRLRGCAEPLERRDRMASSL